MFFSFHFPVAPPPCIAQTIYAVYFNRFRYLFSYDCKRIDGWGLRRLQEKQSHFIDLTTLRIVHLTCGCLTLLRTEMTINIDFNAHAQPHKLVSILRVGQFDNLIISRVAACQRWSCESNSLSPKVFGNGALKFCLYGKSCYIVYAIRWFFFAFCDAQTSISLTALASALPMLGEGEVMAKKTGEVGLRRNIGKRRVDGESGMVN